MLYFDWYLDVKLSRACSSIGAGLPVAGFGSSREMSSLRCFLRGVNDYMSFAFESRERSIPKYRPSVDPSRRRTYPRILFPNPRDVRSQRGLLLCCKRNHLIGSEPLYERQMLGSLATI